MSRSPRRLVGPRKSMNKYRMSAPQRMESAEQARIVTRPEADPYTRARRFLVHLVQHVCMSSSTVEMEGKENPDLGSQSIITATGFARDGADTPSLAQANGH